MLDGKQETACAMSNIAHQSRHDTVNAGVTVEALEVETCIQVCVMLLYSIGLQ